MPKRAYTGTVDRVFLFCRVANIAAGDALAAVWDFDDGGDKTFSMGVQLSSDGQYPASHRGCDTAADLGIKQGIENAVVQGTPWLTGYKESDGWTWETALADMGLQVINEEPV